MVGAVGLSLTNILWQEAGVDSAQGVVVVQARAPRFAAVQHYYEYLGPLHPEFELEGSARSVVQIEGVLPGAVPYVAYASDDLDGLSGVVVDVPTEVYELVGLVVHLAGCIYA